MDHIGKGIYFRLEVVYTEKHRVDEDVCEKVGSFNLVLPTI